MTITDISSGVPVSSHFKTEETSYSERGTLKTTYIGPVTSQSGNTFGISGESKVTGGTRLYRGATGSGTFTGSISPNGLTTTESKGTETY